MKALKILGIVAVLFFVSLGLDVLLPSDPQRVADFILSSWNWVLF
jgi:hypothetical protein